MEKERSVTEVLFGIINLAVSVWFLVYLFPGFAMSYIGGWVADREPNGFYDWLTLFCLSRIFGIIHYLFFVLLFWSGISLLRAKRNGRSLSIFATTGIALTYLASVVNFEIHLIINATHYSHRPINLSTWAWTHFSVPRFFIYFCFYIMIMIFCFARPMNKKQLIVSWVMGVYNVLFSMPILFSPTFGTFGDKLRFLFLRTLAVRGQFPGFGIFPTMLIFGIIAGEVLIYTLRTKNMKCI